jgi:Zn-dependent M28 family amino/carboxypeptidase
MKKTTEYLIDKIVNLRIEKLELENKNRKLSSEKTSAENIILNYKQEVANLRLALSTLQNQETNTNEQPEVIITDRDDK